MRRVALCDARMGWYPEKVCNLVLGFRAGSSVFSPLVPFMLKVVKFFKLWQMMNVMLRAFAVLALLR